MRAGFKRLRLGRLPVPFLIACALMLAGGWLLQYRIFPDGMHLVPDPSRRAGAVVEIAPVTPVVISEAMSSNKTTLLDETGVRPDWFELYNTATEPWDISGWSVSDSLSAGKSFAFPEGTTIPGGGCVLVYAGKYYAAPVGGPYHAPFRLSARGDALLLYNEKGTAVQAINLPALGADQVYARTPAGRYAISNAPTPGRPNEEANRIQSGSARAVREDSPLVISELMADNRSTIRDAAGDYSDWIEIENISGQSVSLAGWSLSDDEDNPGRFRFGDQTLAPGEKLLVFAAGASAATDGLHAPFRIKTENETVTLYDERGAVADQVAIDLLKTDQSLQRQADGRWQVSDQPTPGE